MVREEFPDGKSKVSILPYCLDANASPLDHNGLLVKPPGADLWTSGAACLTGLHDASVKEAPLLKLVGNRCRVTFLSEESSETEAEALRPHERTGKPTGDDGFLSTLEAVWGRSVRYLKPSPEGSARYVWCLRNHGITIG
jgi:hypothetical protein